MAWTKEPIKLNWQCAIALTDTAHSPSLENTRQSASVGTDLIKEGLQESYPSLVSRQGRISCVVSKDLAETAWTYFEQVFARGSPVALVAGRMGLQGIYPSLVSLR